MFVRIDGDRVINTEQIAMIAPAPYGTENPEREEMCLIALAGMDMSYAVEISAATATYLIGLLDVTETVSEEGQPQELSLASRIAIHLRNSRAGQTFTDLQAAFPKVKEEELEAHLNQLRADSVVVSKALNGVNALYFHAANQGEGTW